MLAGIMNANVGKAGLTEAHEMISTHVLDHEKADSFLFRKCFLLLNKKVTSRYLLILKLIDHQKVYV
jgi:hypothetical protein